MGALGEKKVARVSNTGCLTISQRFVVGDFISTSTSLSLPKCCFHSYFCDLCCGKGDMPRQCSDLLW